MKHMAVNDVTQSYAASGTGSSEKTNSIAQGNSELGKEAFLQLLVEQLKNQDPMNPMDNTEYIAQLTQFTSVEQLINISDKLDSLSMNLGSASTLIGKSIEWSELDEDGEVVTKSGTVDSIYAGSDGLYAQVGDTQVLLSVILSVKEPGEGDESGESGEIGDDGSGGGSEGDAGKPEGASET